MRSSPARAAASPPGSGFVESEQAWLTALTAAAFGPSPSVRFGIVDPVEAYLLDEALAIRLRLGTDQRDALPPEMRVEEDPVLAAEIADWHMARLREEGRVH